jgi:formylmethanofuran dehydrogenase subunit A
MWTRLRGGKVYDPVAGYSGQVKDIWICDEKIAEPAPQQVPDYDIDISGMVVMAGAIDMHTHIGGGKVNLARMLLPELQNPQSSRVENWMERPKLGPVPSSVATGCRYAELGYTTCFEPAVLPVNARQSHLEMADTPILDTGGYALLGNEDYLLQMIAAGRPQEEFNDLVAWTLQATQCLGIKVVNAAGINAFKFNQRYLDVHEPNLQYGVTPQQVLSTLCRAIEELGVPHPLHVHASNLGMPGNIKSTLATIAATAPHRVHLTHVQFHAYGNQGVHGMSSAAAEIAEVVNGDERLSIDVGQVMFGQTVTLSGDTMFQHRQSGKAKPHKPCVSDIELEAGCGVVPFRYEQKQFVHALQWAIGLEILLLIKDPWRVFLTTDHPNGGSFTSYPHLIALLMDRSYRERILAELHPDAIAASQLPGIAREYSLSEIAILTRAAPAKILGLGSLGHLSSGAQADIVVYREDSNREKMFSCPAYVLKRGDVVVKEGVVVKLLPGKTHTVRPTWQNSHLSDIRSFFQQHHTLELDQLLIDDEEMERSIGSQLVIHPCRYSRRA